MTWNCPECGREVAERQKRGPHLSACRRTLNAKYHYMPGDSKHPYEWKACAQCGVDGWVQTRQTFCSLRCSRLGVNNPGWKGAVAGYLALHQRVYRLRGKADHCERCGDKDVATCYQWANLTGSYDDPQDYESMCARCHKRYDTARRPNQGRWVYTDEVLAQAAALRAEGRTLKDTASHLGVNVTNLCTRLKQREAQQDSGSEAA